MIRLALLLIGTRFLRPLWPLLLLLGIAWICGGAWLLANLSNRDVVYVEDTLAILIGLDGAIRVVAATILGFRRHWPNLVRGLCLLLTSFLVFNVEWEHNIGATLVFGSAFLIDGLLRIGSAYVLRGTRIRANIAYGTLSLLLSAAIFTRWPISHEVTVPFCISLLLISSGIALVRATFQIRNLPDGGSITTLPLYASFNWQARGVAVPYTGTDVLPVDGELHVRVWTATGSIADPERHLIVDRYVAAVDRKGVVSTGHSAMELPPDLYISHYPDADIDHSPDELQTILHSGAKNDVKGRFQPSLEIESANWCMPDQTVTFHRYNEAALRAFWAAYSSDDTYNLTARNCSTTVILALDAATEGLASTGKPARDFIRLVFNLDFWILRTIRGRAEGMTWTPGLVLDYSRMLVRVLERTNPSSNDANERRVSRALGDA